MPQSKQEAHIYQEDEIDLRSLFNSLVARRFLIAGLTGFVTVLAILYALTITPTYIVSSSFISASKSSIATINHLGLTTETKESVLTKFLNQIASYDMQLKVFVDGNYLTALNSENEQVDDIKAYTSSFLSSFLIVPPVTKSTKNETTFNLLEKSYSISMKGGNIEIISRYLNELIASTNIQTIDDLTSETKLKISMRLEEILIERRLLLELAEKNRFLKIERIKEEDGQKIRQINDQIDALRLQAKRDRLNQIERIKEEDGQKIREINDQIARVKYKAKENRLNQIEVLTDAAKLAGFLGIIENNLEQIDKVDKNNFNFNIAINDDADLPEWYLYGEKALIQRVELLESRKSDDPFIPELVTLNNQLNEIQLNNTLKTLEARQNDDPFIPEIVSLQKTLKEVQLNNTLKTLEARQDDSPFIAEIVNLTIEKNKLESSVINISGANAIQIRQVVTSKALKSNKRMIVLLAFIGSFVLSLFLALIMDALKPDEKTPA
jgi:LPS O-antigen subunit length determinant protein (WzzB/FepE family)